MTGGMGDIGGPPRLVQDKPGRAAVRGDRRLWAAGLVLLAAIPLLVALAYSAGLAQSSAPRAEATQGPFTLADPGMVGLTLLVALVVGSLVGLLVWVLGRAGLLSRLRAVE